ncbi:MAG: transcription-repair coupling factor, partial [Tannerella sp.]|nr:transcription-repair coupling factor [Tannerella sp.]
YQKILEEAVDELKTDEFTDLFAPAGEQSDNADAYVRETFIESDLELMFAPTYIPSDSERVSIYRELDTIENEAKLSEFTNRLKDRFGAIPKEGEELIRVISLRWSARQLGIEKIVLKREMMAMYLPSNPGSPYYQSRAFGKFLTYIQRYPRACTLREQAGKRSIIIKNITNVAAASRCLQEIEAING